MINWLLQLAVQLDIMNVESHELGYVIMFHGVLLLSMFQNPKSELCVAVMMLYTCTGMSFRTFI